jgi:hypothetical protein
VLSPKARRKPEWLKDVTIEYYINPVPLGFFGKLPSIQLPSQVPRVLARQPRPFAEKPIYFRYDVKIEGVRNRALTNSGRSFKRYDHATLCIVARARRTCSLTIALSGAPPPQPSRATDRPAPQLVTTAAVGASAPTRG